MAATELRACRNTVIATTALDTLSAVQRLKPSRGCHQRRRPHREAGGNEDRAGASAFAEAVARLLDEECVLTKKLTKEAVDEAVRRAVERTVADARAAVAQDVNRLPEIAGDLYGQRRRSLLLDIGGLAERVRAFSAPPEMSGAKWLLDADLDGDGQAPAKALLPASWAAWSTNNGGERMRKHAPTKLTPRMPTRANRPPRSENAFWLRRADKERAVVGCVSPWTQSEVVASRLSLGLPSSPSAKSAMAKKVLKARPALRRLLAVT